MSGWIQATKYATKKYYSMKKLVDITYVTGGHGVGINIHACQSNLEMAIYVLKSANGNDIMP